VTIVEVIETNSYSIYEVKIEIENLISELSNLDRSSIEQNISNLTRTFSVLQKYTYDIKEMFEDFRSKSQNLFEPIETLYEIISKASEDYDQISKTVISYLKESNVFSKTISDALKKQYDKLSEIIDSLRRIALNLKNIGINATVEFSRLSSSEALFQISRKIIDTSKNLQDLVLNSSIFIDEVRNDISQTLKKIDSFYSMVGELFNDMQKVSDTVESLISDKEKVIDNIRHNYNVISSISGILNEIEKITANMNSVYYSLESNIKSLLGLVNLGEQVKPVLDVLDTTYSSLIEIKNTFVRVVEDLRRYK
jgi:methyl-accepting chemotaxis protein